MSHLRLWIAIGKAELSFPSHQSAVDPAGTASWNVSPELCKSTLKKWGGFLFPFLRFAQSSITVSFSCRAQCLAFYCFQTILCLTPSTDLQKARKASRERTKCVWIKLCVPWLCSPCCALGAEALMDKLVWEQRSGSGDLLSPACGHAVHRFCCYNGTEQEINSNSSKVHNNQIIPTTRSTWLKWQARTKLREGKQVRSLGIAPWRGYWDTHSLSPPAITG